MQANEIRKVAVYGGDAGTAEIAEFLREIAAQLAELNTKLSDVIDPGAGEQFPGYVRVMFQDKR